MEILRDELGAPYFNFYGKAAEIVFKCDYRASVSLSHEEDKAIAMVILEKGKNIVDTLGRFGCAAYTPADADVVYCDRATRPEPAIVLQDKTLEAVGKQIGRSKESVGRTCKEVIKKIQQKFTVEQFKEILY